MNHTKSLLLVVLLIVGSFSLASAQRVKSRHRIVNTEEKVEEDKLAAYVDSLSMYKAQLDSIMQLKDSLQQSSATDTRYYRLFTPLTYYPDVIGNQMSGSNDSGEASSDGEIENVLTDMYFNHPELVETTVKRLHESAARADDHVTKPVKRKVEVAKEQIHVEEEAPMDGPMDLFVYKPNFWKFSGDYSLQFMQSYLSDNWYQSGESNLSMLGAVTLQLNYNNKQKVKFDNKLEMKLGFQTSESDEVHKFKTTSDLLRYTGKLGIQATKNWYYTLQGIATTQFAHGLKSNDETVYSAFLSPVIVNLSLGMDYNISAWKGKLTGSAHIAPFAYNWKHVNRGELATRYGIDEGKHTLEDYGSQFTLNLVWKLATNVKWTSRLYGYTTYKRAELEWENTISLAVSKYITTNIFLYPRFDDGVKRADDQSYWQFKEYISLGFAYSM